MSETVITVLRFEQSCGKLKTAPKERANAPQGLTLNRPNSIGGLAVNATRTCSIDACDRPHKGRGLCNVHYAKWRRESSPEELLWQTRSERFWAKVDRSGGPSACWPFTATRNEAGYGLFRDGTRTVRAHRYAYLTEFGHEPEGVIDHTCHNETDCPGGPSCPHRACVNPRHLEDVTHAVNVARGKAGVNQPRGPRVTHCKHGHRYDEANTYVNARGHQYCRACNRARQRALREESR